MFGVKERWLFFVREGSGHPPTQHNSARAGASRENGVVIAILFAWRFAVGEGGVVFWRVTS